MENQIISSIFTKLTPTGACFCVSLTIVGCIVIAGYGISKNYSFNLGNVSIQPQT